MPSIDFDGENLHMPAQSRSAHDTTVAVTRYELETLMALAPSDRALPVRAVNGVAVIWPTAHADLWAVVALARMREGTDGPYVQTADFAAQEPVQPQDEHGAPGRDVRLERLADDFQDVLERFMARVEVDPEKYDHQNRAGDVVALLLTALRRHDYLPEPVDEPLPPNAWRVTRDYYLSHHQDVRAAVAKGISTASLSSLRETARIGQLIMDELDALFESRDVKR